MFTNYITLGFVIFLRGTWSAPSPRAESAGTTLSDDFKSNLGLMMNNLHTGASKVASKPIVFGVDTLPNLVTQGSKTAADKFKNIADANNKAFGEMAVGVGHAAGGGGVLASSVAGGALQIAGAGLGVANDVINTGAKAGINLSGKLGDKAAGGIEIGGTLGNSAFTAIGDGLTAAGGGAKAVSQLISELIIAIGDKTASSMVKVEKTAEELLDKGSKLVGDGVMSGASKAQVQYYSMLKNYLELLIKCQNMFDNTLSLMKPSSSSAAADAAATATTTAGAAVETNNAAKSLLNPNANKASFSANIKI